MSSFTSASSVLRCWILLQLIIFTILNQQSELHLRSARAHQSLSSFGLFLQESLKPCNNFLTKKWTLRPHTSTAEGSTPCTQASLPTRPKLEPGHGPVVGRIQHVMEAPTWDTWRMRWLFPGGSACTATKLILLYTGRCFTTVDLTVVFLPFFCVMLAYWLRDCVPTGERLWACGWHVAGWTRGCSKHSSCKSPRLYTGPSYMYAGEVRGDLLVWNVFELSFATGRCIRGGYRGGGPKQLTGPPETQWICWRWGSLLRRKSSTWEFGRHQAVNNCDICVSDATLKEMQWHRSLADGGVK